MATAVLAFSPRLKLRSRTGGPNGGPEITPEALLILGIAIVVGLVVAWFC